MNSETEQQKPKRRSETGGNGFETFLPFNLPQWHVANAATLTRANEIFAQTARTVWENEAELFRLEAERARRAFEPLKPGRTAQSFPDMLDQFRRSTEQAIVHMRAINDAVCECEWQLLALAADSFVPPAQKSAE